MYTKGEQQPMILLPNIAELNQRQKHSTTLSVLNGVFGSGNHGSFLAYQKGAFLEGADHRKLHLDDHRNNHLVNHSKNY